MSIVSLESAAPLGVAWSMCVLDADSGEVIAESAPELLLKTASVGKIFLLIEVARQIEAGELDPDEPLTRTPEEWVADSGLWQVLGSEHLTVRDAAALIGAVSDNLATNVLLRRVGVDAVAATTASLGVASSRLLDRVREERLPEHPPTLSLGCAGELARVLGALHRGAVVSREVSTRVLCWLALNTDLSMVASAFGLDPLAHQEADRGLRLWNKTGTISTARIDVGVVAGPHRSLAYAVLANWTAADVSDANDPRDEVLHRMAEIGADLRRFIA